MSRRRAWKAKKFGPKPMATIKPGTMVYVEVPAGTFNAVQAGVTYTFPIVSVSNGLGKSGFSYSKLASGEMDETVNKMLEQFGHLAQMQPLTADQVKTIIGLESNGNPSASPTN